MADILMNPAGQPECNAPYPLGGKGCERPARHDVHMRRVSGGSDGWILDHADTRRMVAEEIAAAIEAEVGRAKAAHYKSALAKASRIAREHASMESAPYPTPEVRNA